ncbi:complement regulator-acquiring protein (plasmid) [Borreliella carolinensis]|uniref:Complement regulator-acquiring protein n=1 Tax=Borreliella carolinensis TaxID=478174 RepID=A0ABY9E610_9SPIR|nr:complement regulator-acquiring protein [Borreliella carolinensis]WKC90405.1 complement regulator-acquiring protein [Borreliella carolinensis]WNY63384.1 complement regulator-acquiring protein [Borreliella carolinensis]WNY68232.1 complement regulator-acquiring protein [Borreliella carolinensis]
MKNNKLIAIFLLHTLTVLILLSCSLEVKDGDENKKHKKEKTKISKTENNSLKNKKMSKNGKSKIDNLLVAINTLKNPPKISAGNKNKPNSAALKQKNNPNNANVAPKQILDPEATELIQKILDRSENIIQISEIDSYKGEPDDQFGMKKEIFSKIFFNANSTVHFDENEYTSERRMLYTSLNFNEGKIIELGKILSKLSQDSNYRGLVKETLINRGFSIQLAMEEISAKILNVKDKLQNLNKANLKALYHDFEQLTPLKEKWLKDTDDFINEYNANNDLQTDVSKLNDALRSKNSRAQFADIHDIILNLVNTTTNILAPIQ